MEALLLAVIVVALLALRQNIIIILIVAACFAHLAWGDADLTYLIDDVWTSVNRDVLLAIPMFILAGSIMTRGSIAERLIGIMRAMTNWLPGGLAVATILSCAVFAASATASSSLAITPASSLPRSSSTSVNLSFASVNLVAIARIDAGNCG